MKNQKKLNIALFGGSFDPPHIGHQMIVNTALKELDIDKLFIVPAYLNPFKKSYFAPPKKRYKWVKKLFKDNEKVEVLDFEIKKERSVPTIETVKYLYNTYDIDKFYLIIGDDNLKSLHKWKDYEKLKQMVTFVVVTRYESFKIFNKIIDKNENFENFISCPNGQSFSERNFRWNSFPTKRRITNGKEYPKNLKILKISANISSTKLRINLDAKFLPNSISKDIINYYN